MGNKIDLKRRFSRALSDAKIVKVLNYVSMLFVILQMPLQDNTYPIRGFGLISFAPFPSMAS